MTVEQVEYRQQFVPVVHIGVHCSKCQVTYWTADKQPEPYDFLHFDKLVRREVEDFVPSVATDETGLVEFELPDPNLLLNEKFLPTLPFHNGITLIKSPKGTGKTTYLKNLVSDYRNQGKRVLLVGHRRSLLRALSESLGLQCYLDAKEFAEFAPKRIAKHFAVSVDSLATMLKPNVHKFDVVLIDESEQVFSHLIADTIDLGNQITSMCSPTVLVDRWGIDRHPSVRHFSRQVCLTALLIHSGIPTLPD